MSPSKNDASSDAAKRSPTPTPSETPFERAILNRLSRAAGHLQAIKRMVEEKNDLETIVVQLTAVKSAVDGVGKAVLQELIANRAEALTPGDVRAFADFRATVAKYLK